MSTADITWADVARASNAHAESVGEWAGAPVPLPGMDLVIEPRYPFRLDELHFDDPHALERATSDNEYEVVSQWDCASRHGTVVHYREPGQKIKGIVIPWAAGGRVHKLLSVLEVANHVWGINAEMTAQEKLMSLVTPVAFKQYMMTGMFIESSKRSGVAYVFRRLRPTIALGGGTGEMKVLCCLCLHSIGYYKETWAGAMVPTDDVIAALLMMRGNEPKFWAKANQIAALKPEAGLY